MTANRGRTHQRPSQSHGEAFGPTLLPAGSPRRVLPAIRDFAGDEDDREQNCERDEAKGACIVGVVFNRFQDAGESVASHLLPKLQILGSKT
jgi:hypothetical protein